ncbi:4Fe-4S dicluster domain-containing protein [Sulfurimonas sp.]|uniref:4Fe-4S dicluster domain-containing protein n=1 Tax=Sulfurimonas sp. TaxID=2022749 RepID=UPI002B45FFE2|nr:4Fe-4S dicluster domain-containing protein [Sulfurimonas sp.]
MGTFKTVNPGDQPVWVNTSNCKACDICVSVCPSGVLAMRYEISSTLGAMISIEHPEACIGCSECELSCPDFAIYVADRKDLKEVGLSFAKLTDEAKTRQEAIKANNYYSIEQGAR